MIKPTIGRIVWYWNGNANPEKDQPLAAIVTHVHSDTAVNLAVFNEGGVPMAMLNVRLVQPEEVEAGEPLAGNAQWMPFQVSTAAASQKEQLAPAPVK